MGGGQLIKVSWADIRILLASTWRDRPAALAAHLPWCRRVPTKTAEKQPMSSSRAIIAQCLRLSDSAVSDCLVG